MVGEKREPMTLSTSSSLSIALVLAVISGVAGGAMWATRIEMRLERIEVAVDEAGMDRWYGSSMNTWVHRANVAADAWVLRTERLLGVELPTLNFPSPIGYALTSDD